MRPILALGMLVLLAAPAGASAQCPDGTPPPCGPAQPRLTRIQVLASPRPPAHFQMHLRYERGLDPLRAAPRYQRLLVAPRN